MHPAPPCIIRAMEPDDYADLWEIWNCPQVVRHTLRLPYSSKADAQSRVSNPPAGFSSLVAVVEGKVVGQCGLHAGRGRRAHVGGLGLMVHDDYTRRGVGSALLTAMIDLAEGWLGLTRLELEVHVDNAVAIRLYERHGFVVEGTKRQCALRDGAYVDTHMMAWLGPTHDRFQTA